MRKVDIKTDLSTLAFNFFYWFSRFEFALKENGYLRTHRAGARAEPGWSAFTEAWSSAYTPSEEARRLLANPPEQQVIGLNNALNWAPVDLTTRTSELAMVVRLVTTIRNNLFHGGKHGGAYWDDPARTEALLSLGITVLDQLADLGRIDSDFRRQY